MALQKGVNSYVDLAEAEAYFADRLDVAAWTDAGDEQKQKSLVTATMLIEQKQFTGYAVSDTQALAFPRTGEYFDKRLGRMAYFNGTPSAVLKATCEQAYHLLNNDGLLDTGSIPDSLTVGPISLNGLSKTPTFSAVAYNLIAPLLSNGGASSWWRAN